MIEEQCVGFLNTPPLWEKEQFDINQFDFPNIDAQLFQAIPIPQNIRLGHQMEYIFKQLIEFSTVYKVIVYNLQIQHEKSTLGEIDFILQDNKSKKLIHVELTYKFYIIDPTISEPIKRLIGPNRRDSFFDKMQKIKNIQFPLLHAKAGVNSLQNIQIDHTQIDHQCCFKAQLFKPYGSRSINIEPLNNECLAGYWLRIDDLTKPEFNESMFYIPTKSEWVIAPHDQVTWKYYDEISKVIKHSLLQERSPMVWLKKPDQQYEKLFIVWW